MFTDIDIVNQALGRIDKGFISDFDDTRDTARNIKAIYRQEFDCLLTAFPWSFARRVAVLARLDLSDDLLATIGYRFGYRMPADSLQVLRVHDGSDREHNGFFDGLLRRFGYDEERYDVYRYDDKLPAALFTDMHSVRILYLSQNTSVNNLNPEARDALISRVAYSVALTDQNSSTVASQQLERYQQSLALAIKRDNRDEPKTMPRNLYRRGRYFR